MLSSITLTCGGVLAILGLLLTGSSRLARAQGSPTGGPTDSKELRAFTDAFLVEQMEKLHIPGAVFVLVKEGRILFTKGYGYADLEKKTPVIPDKTLFRVASVSKLFTATAVMQLYERGTLNLEDDVNRHLTLFALEDNYPRPVTVANLLTHTGGFDERWIGMIARTEAEVVPLGPYLAARMPPRVLPPAELIGYSNHGMALAGYLVEVISGVPFSRYIDEYILQPLGMHRSSFVLPPHLEPDLAVGYVYKNGTYQRVPFYYIHTAPASTLVTTATDVARFMIAHLQHGRYGNSRILKAVTAREMHRQHFTHHPRLPGFTYGFFEHFENNQRAIMHDGGMTGFSSRLFLLPDRNLGFFVSSNISYQLTFFEEFTKRFLDHYYPLREKPAPPEPPTDFRNRASRFTGSYRSNPYFRRTLEKLVTLFGQFRVTDDGSGGLTLHFPGGLLEPHRGVEVEPLLFQSVDDNGYAAFRNDGSGRITHLFIGPLALEKLPWYETTAFQLSLTGSFALVFLSACTVWPVGRLVRRWRKQPLHAAGSTRLARFLAGLIGGLNLVFLIGLAFAMLLIDELEFTYGLPPLVIALLFIPLLTTSLTVGLPIFAVLVWKNRYWSVMGRLHYSLITLATVAYIMFLLYWNLLGFRF